jgi:hypothetical protein
MSARPPNWGEFSRKQAGAAPATGDTADFSETCMRVFTSPDGRDLLKHLYAEVVDARGRPQASDAELREAEAQRRLVFRLEQLRDEGIERARQRTEKASDKA